MRIFLSPLPLCLVSRASSTRNNRPLFSSAFVCLFQGLVFAIAWRTVRGCSIPWSGDYPLWSPLWGRFRDLGLDFLPLNSSEVVEYLNYVDLGELLYLWGNYWSNFWGVFWMGFWSDLLEIFLDVFLVACRCSFWVNDWAWVANNLEWIYRKSWKEWFQDSLKNVSCYKFQNIPS